MALAVRVVYCSPAFLPGTVYSDCTPDPTTGRDFQVGGVEITEPRARFSAFDSWGLSPCYLQLKEKLEHEFPGCLDICGEGTPQVTGFFEVTVAGKLVHSKKRGDGYVDTESKFRKLVTAIKAALAQCQ
ncbi:Selenoprotein W [Microtus ochrogaster]|uniref:Selenoprotein W n=1 Tax=Microtus ochrogaster TaxID=79684 RepID=A0A8J6KMS0_MICOH|nr:Selenoprotein W [Microtus ochrogaster]